MSRIQASSAGMPTTVIPGPSASSAPATSSGCAATVTGSCPAIVRATSAKAARAGPAASRQLSGRRGQAIQVPAWGSNSPGIRNPSAAGVVARGSAVTRRPYRSPTPGRRSTRTRSEARAEQLGSVPTVVGSTHPSGRADEPCWTPGPRRAKMKQVSIPSLSAPPRDRARPTEAGMEFWLFMGGFIHEDLMASDPDAEHHRLMSEVDLAVVGDRSNWKYSWWTEHHFLWESSHISANETIMPFVAAKTNRMHIGSGIINITPPVNHPARVAERVAMLDHLSEGRFEFGTGRGSSSIEQSGFGIDDPDDTKVMFDEVIGEFKHMWRDGPYSHTAQS